MNGSRAEKSLTNMNAPPQFSQLNQSPLVYPSPQFKRDLEYQGMNDAYLSRNNQKLKHHNSSKSFEKERSSWNYN